MEPTKRDPASAIIDMMVDRDLFAGVDDDIRLEIEREIAALIAAAGARPAVPEALPGGWEIDDLRACASEKCAPYVAGLCQQIQSLLALDDANSLDRPIGMMAYGLLKAARETILSTQRDVAAAERERDAARAEVAELREALGTPAFYYAVEDREIGGTWDEKDWHLDEAGVGAIVEVGSLIEGPHWFGVWVGKERKWFRSEDEARAALSARQGGREAEPDYRELNKALDARQGGGE